MNGQAYQNELLDLFIYGVNLVYSLYPSDYILLSGIPQALPLSPVSHRNMTEQ